MSRLIDTSRGALPKTEMTPELGCSRPRIILMVVDLPDPLGPSRPKTSPRRTSRSISLTAFTRSRIQKSLKTFVSRAQRM